MLPSDAFEASREILRICPLLDFWKVYAVFMESSGAEEAKARIKACLN